MATALSNEVTTGFLDAFGDAWDLGHRADRRQAARPQCLPCNRATNRKD